MKIAIIGAGAMGTLFSGYLSKDNEVYLIGRNIEKSLKAQSEGVIISELDGSVNTYYPHAVVDTKDIGTMDVVILFVKSMASKTALDSNRHLIGDDTLLMTLQNGSGHDELLKQYVKIENVVIGTTQQGSYVTGDNSICHSGLGATKLGVISGDNVKVDELAKTFNNCGFDTEKSDNIKYLIWHKLIINVSTSVLSGVLGIAQGYCVEDEAAWEITKQLITETVAVAKADGINFDVDEQIERVKTHIGNARSGYTSIYADLRDGRLTEVDTISGSVVHQGKKLGVPTPTHDLIVKLVHAMENRNSFKL